MGIETRIEFCDSSCNPIMGCSPGCELYHPDPSKNHCYAARLCRRYAGRKGWPTSFDQPEFFPGRLEKALGWPDLTGKDRLDEPWLSGLPRIIFVNDLGDGFCPGVDADEWLPPQMIGKMAASPHVWLLLTKWPRRMRKFFAQYQVPANFWLGTSICYQHDEWRVEELLAIRGARTKWISLEPLLGAVDLDYPCLYNDLNFADTVETMAEHGERLWCITGGESGPGARPMHPQWARDLHDQCLTANAPWFFKQHGAWIHESQMSDGRLLGTLLRTEIGLPGAPRATHEWEDGTTSYLVGKKHSGRLFDGSLWNEIPAGSQEDTQESAE